MDEVYIRRSDLNNYITKYFNSEFITIDDLISVIEHLDKDLDSLQEQYDDLKQDLFDNYKPIPVEEQYEITDRDFM